MNRPIVVTLCGSTRFMDAFQTATLTETLAGRIVLSVGCNTKSDAMLGLAPEVKDMLDELHLRKIDLSDVILVLNVGGYIGESTRREIAYAEQQGKQVRWLEGCNVCVAVKNIHHCVICGTLCCDEHCYQEGPECFDCGCK